MALSDIARSYSTATTLRRELRLLADADIAQHSQRFFKTAAGEYGEGDRFLGIRVPPLRKLAKQCPEIEASELAKLVRSRYHEERMLGLLILVAQFRGADDAASKALYEFYLDHKSFVNNWDLVDCSASQVVGSYLQYRPRRILYQLARSDVLWDRRIAIISTHHFIRAGDFADTLKLAGKLLRDPQDLIHKAVGWMLREVGNRDRATEEAFLREHYRAMPRTMLRYAIEKFPDARRRAYLRGML